MVLWLYKFFRILKDNVQPSIVDHLEAPLLTLRQFTRVLEELALSWVQLLRSTSTPSGTQTADASWRESVFKSCLVGVRPTCSKSIGATPHRTYYLATLFRAALETLVGQLQNCKRSRQSHPAEEPDAPFPSSRDPKCKAGVRLVRARLSLENRHHLYRTEQHCAWLVEVADAVAREYNHQRCSFVFPPGTPDTCQAVAGLQQLESKCSNGNVYF